MTVQVRKLFGGTPSLNKLLLMCICSLNIAMSHTSRLESTLFPRREKAQNTESCAFSRVRTDVWERVQLSWQSLACWVFLYRFQVLDEIEDDACALITKKGCCFFFFFLKSASFRITGFVKVSFLHLHTMTSELITGINLPV